LHGGVLGFDFVVSGDWQRPWWWRKETEIDWIAGKAEFDFKCRIAAI
jgi:hypothetical protein